jgi:hypothetical protein
LRCNNASLLTITGFASPSPVDGDQIDVVALNAEVGFVHASTDSLVANRLSNRVTSCPTPITSGGGSAQFRYDATSQVWRMRDHEQGTWIASAIASFGINGGGSATPTYSVNRYRIDGRTLWWSIYLLWTPTGTVSSIDVAYPVSGAANAAQFYSWGYAANANGAVGTRLSSPTGAAGATSARLEHINTTGTNQAFGTGANAAQGVFTIELQ